MRKEIIDNAIDYIKKIFNDDATGHDCYHSLRVYKMATYIAKQEDADLFIVQLVALLHDVDDYKLQFGNYELKNARCFMKSNGISEVEINTICKTISEISFKGTKECIPSTLEGRIVQDADRLDSIGAIGIARTFAYGGSIGREIYIPEILPKSFQSNIEYKNYVGTTINHFYEKLLKLKNDMNTEAGKRMALEKHIFMETFLEKFFDEWECGEIND